MYKSRIIQLIFFILFIFNDCLAHHTTIHIAQQAAAERAGPIASSGISTTQGLIVNNTGNSMSDPSVNISSSQMNNNRPVDTSSLESMSNDGNAINSMTTSTQDRTGTITDDHTTQDGFTENEIAFSVIRRGAQSRSHPDISNDPLILNSKTIVNDLIHQTSDSFDNCETVTTTSDVVENHWVPNLKNCARAYSPPECSISRTVVDAEFCRDNRATKVVSYPQYSMMLTQADNLYMSGQWNGRASNGWLLVAQDVKDFYSSSIAAGGATTIILTHSGDARVNSPSNQAFFGANAPNNNWHTIVTSATGIYANRFGGIVLDAWGFLRFWQVAANTESLGGGVVSGTNVPLTVYRNGIRLLKYPFIISEQNELFATGENVMGILGYGNASLYSGWRFVMGNVVNVWQKNMLSMVLTESGDLYRAGGNKTAIISFQYQGVSEQRWGSGRRRPYLIGWTTLHHQVPICIDFAFTYGFVLERQNVSLDAQVRIVHADVWMEPKFVTLRSPVGAAGIHSYPTDMCGIIVKDVNGTYTKGTIPTSNPTQPSMAINFYTRVTDRANNYSRYTTWTEIGANESNIPKLIYQNSQYFVSQACRVSGVVLPPLPIQSVFGPCLDRGTYTIYSFASTISVTKNHWFDLPAAAIRIASTPGLFIVNTADILYAAGNNISGNLGIGTTTNYGNWQLSAKPQPNCQVRYSEVIADSPPGCSTALANGSACYPHPDFDWVPTTEPLDQKSNHTWQCTDASTDRFLSGELITVPKFGGLMGELYPSEDLSNPNVCYQAVARNNVCDITAPLETWTDDSGVFWESWIDADGSHECRTPINGQRTCTLSPIFASNMCQGFSHGGCIFRNSNCAVWDTANSSQCLVYNEEWDCGTNQRIVVATETSSELSCNAPISCMGNDCVSTTVESNDDFNRVAATLDVATELAREAECGLAGCQAFEGEFYQCKRVLESLGMQNCCLDDVAGVSLTDYLTAMKSAHTLMELTGAYESLAAIGVDIPGAWDTLTDVASSTWETVKEPFVSTWESFTQTSTGATATDISANAANATTATASQQVVSNVAEFTADVFGEDVAVKMFEKGVNGSWTGNLSPELTAFTESFGTVVNFATNVYTAYTTIKLAIQIIYECEPKEMELAVKRKLKSCVRLGTESRGALGLVSYERYCCFDSPLATIIQKNVKGYDYQEYETISEPDHPHLVVAVPVDPTVNPMTSPPPDAMEHTFNSDGFIDWYLRPMYVSDLPIGAFDVVMSATAVREYKNPVVRYRYPTQDHLGIDWGNRFSGAPNCSGFAINALSNIQWGALDLTEWVQIVNANVSKRNPANANVHHDLRNGTRREEFSCDTIAEEILAEGSYNDRENPTVVIASPNTLPSDLPDNYISYTTDANGDVIDYTVPNIITVSDMTTALMIARSKGCVDVPDGKERAIQRVEQVDTEAVRQEVRDQLWGNI
ncbi:MAG: conjugal transfer protein TraN [Gammaproteobacteria bacterium]|nr:conjugal transfer protein TraN [Gammaproteobacteria bacterium]